MTDPLLPLLVEPGELQARLGTEGLLIVDLGRPETYAGGHVPGAVHLDYAAIVASRPPVGGLLPGAEHLGRALSAIGLTPDVHVLAYDDEGGGRAGRLLWTLDVLGHPRASLLNGGLHAWANEGHPLERSPVQPSISDYTAVLGDHCRADRNWILARLGRKDVAFVDTRTPEEYAGIKRVATKGGHIPGAVNLDWVRTMDRGRNLRLLPEPELRAMYEALGVAPDLEVVVYCQTHHRSSHSYVVLKSLGYPMLRGYPGAWSDWGNAEETPVEN